MSDYIPGCDIITNFSSKWKDSLVSKVWVVTKADFEFFYRKSKDFRDNI